MKLTKENLIHMCVYQSIVVVIDYYNYYYSGELMIFWINDTTEVNSESDHAILVLGLSMTCESIVCMNTSSVLNPSLSLVSIYFLQEVNRFLIFWVLLV